MGLAEYDYNKLTKKYDKAVAALIEIERGQGPFSMDQQKFANNTIAAMKVKARDCLNELKVTRDEVEHDDE